MLEGSVVAQAVSRRSAGEEARARYRASPCETSGGPNDTAPQICLRGVDKDHPVTRRHIPEERVPEVIELL